MTQISYPLLVKKIHVANGQGVKQGERVLDLEDREGSAVTVTADQSGIARLLVREGDLLKKPRPLLEISAPGKSRRAKSPEELQTEVRGTLKTTLFVVTLGLLGLGGWSLSPVIFPEEPVVIAERPKLTLEAWGAGKASDRASNLSGSLLEKSSLTISLSQAQRQRVTQESFLLGRASGGAFDMLRDTENGLRLERWEKFGDRWQSTPWFSKDNLSSPSRPNADWLGFTEAADGTLTAWVQSSGRGFTGVTASDPVNIEIGTLDHLKNARLVERGGTTAILAIQEDSGSAAGLLYWQEGEDPSLARPASLFFRDGETLDFITLIKGGERPQVLVSGVSRGNLPWWAIYEVSGNAFQELSRQILPRSDGWRSRVSHVEVLGEDLVLVLTRERNPRDVSANQSLEEIYIGRWKREGESLVELWGQWWASRIDTPDEKKHFRTKLEDMTLLESGVLVALLQVEVRSTLSDFVTRAYGTLFIDQEQGWHKGVAFFDGETTQDFRARGMQASKEGVLVYGDWTYNRLLDLGESEDLVGNSRAGLFFVTR